MCIGGAADGRDPRRKTLRVLRDKSGTNTSLRPLYAWSRQLERAASRATGEEPHPTLQHDPFGHGPVRGGGGATTRAVFETHAEEVLCPSLSPGQVVPMDNLSATR